MLSGLHRHIGHPVEIDLEVGTKARGRKMRPLSHCHGRTIIPQLLADCRGLSFCYYTFMPSGAPQNRTELAFSTTETSPL
jgi:hypothetical protein